MYYQHSAPSSSTHCDKHAQKDVVRVCAKKYDADQNLSDTKRFSIDPSVTTYAQLRELLAKAFHIQTDFVISYLIPNTDPTDDDRFLPMLSDWDLSAATYAASNPMLMLKCDVKPIDKIFDEWDIIEDVDVALAQTEEAEAAARQHRDKSRSPSVQRDTKIMKKCSKTRLSATEIEKMRTQCHNTQALQSYGQVVNGHLLPSSGEEQRQHADVSKRRRALQTAKSTTVAAAKSLIPFMPGMGVLPSMETMIVGRKDTPVRRSSSKAPPLDDAEWRDMLDAQGRLRCQRQLRLAVYQRGVAASLRSVVWRHLLNVYPEAMTGEQRMNYIRLLSGQYQQQKQCWQSRLRSGRSTEELRIIANAVRKDVVRTDRLLPFYAGDENSNPNLLSLFNILTTYALCHPDVTYCQGMSDLCSPLLYVMQDEAQVYISFCALMRRVKPNFSCDGRSMTRKFQHLSELLQFYDPVFFEYLREMHTDDLLFAYRWLLLELKREFTFNDSLRVLEVMWASLPPDSPANVLSIYEVDLTACQDMPFSPSLLHLPTDRTARLMSFVAYNMSNPDLQQTANSRNDSTSTDESSGPELDSEDDGSELDGEVFDFIIGSPSAHDTTIVAAASASNTTTTDHDHHQLAETSSISAAVDRQLSISISDQSITKSTMNRSSSAPWFKQHARTLSSTKTITQTTQQQQHETTATPEPNPVDEIQNCTLQSVQTHQTVSNTGSHPIAVEGNDDRALGAGWQHKRLSDSAQDSSVIHSCPGSLSNGLCHATVIRHLMLHKQLENTGDDADKTLQNADIDTSNTREDSSGGQSGVGSRDRDVATTSGSPFSSSRSVTPDIMVRHIKPSNELHVTDDVPENTVTEETLVPNGPPSSGAMHDSTTRTSSTTSKRRATMPLERKSSKNESTQSASPVPVASEADVLSHTDTAVGDLTLNDIFDICVGQTEDAESSARLRSALSSAASRSRNTSGDPYMMSHRHHHQPHVSRTNNPSGASQPPPPPHPTKAKTISGGSVKSRHASSTQTANSTAVTTKDSGYSGYTTPHTSTALKSTVSPGTGKQRVNEELESVLSNAPSHTNGTQDKQIHEDGDSRTTTADAVVTPAYAADFSGNPQSLVNIEQRWLLPPPSDLGDGNPLLMFICLTLLLEHRDHIVKHQMDFNEIAIYFDKLARKHNASKVLRRARRLYKDYLNTQSMLSPK